MENLVDFSEIASLPLNPELTDENLIFLIFSFIRRNLKFRKMYQVFHAGMVSAPII